MLKEAMPVQYSVNLGQMVTWARSHGQMAMWPWPLPYDLDIQQASRCCSDRCLCKISSS